MMPEPSGHCGHSRLCDASTLWSYLSFAVYHFMVRRHAALVHNNREYCMHQNNIEWHRMTLMHLGGNVKQVVVAAQVSVCTCQAGGRCWCLHDSI